MNSIILSASLLFLFNIYCTDRDASNPKNYFEGTVKYKGDFLRKTNKYDSTTLALIVGNFSTVYVKEGDYLVTIDNGLTTRTLYRKRENKFYRERFNSDTVYWTRCDTPAPKIVKFTKRSKAENVLGIDCDELKIYYDNRTVTYYYNSDTLRSNPDWFKGATAYNENFSAQEMKSVSLKTVIEYTDFTATQTAIRITNQKLNNTLFDIPKKPLVEDK
jgi:hypothetical protein